MRIRNLTISNFRGIRDVQLTALGSMIVIAGQNGSGKSCVFDAIRLLKSVYGGYQQNEIQQWMGEFQVDLFRSNFTSIVNSPSRELSITCDFQLADDERDYLRSNAEEVLRETIWRNLLPEAYQWSSPYASSLMPQYREKEPEVRTRLRQLLPKLEEELAGELIRASFRVPPGQQAHYSGSAVLGIVFSLFRPERLGVIDYHGAQRHYNREAVQGVNLNLDANAQQQRSQTALYNYGAKYANVKSEMAASYIRDILSGRALGLGEGQQQTLTNTLKELFQTFFPDKEFLGPQPTSQGALAFPVRTANGGMHDLDELSAGEKEILYGYLRIRNSAPKNSIILLDEPELHLNPRLVRNLPGFYKKHLGEELGNQMWLVTHSDALIREVVGSAGYDVFHMLPCGAAPEGMSQLKKLTVSAEVDAAVVDLVGDLAAYHPGGKVIILEGGGDSDFDQRVVGTLFPELQQRVNLISGSNKIRVRALHETLQSLSKQGALPVRFYAITDADSGVGQSVEEVDRYQWDVYHIENYFLSPGYIRLAMEAIGQIKFDSEVAILEELKRCAQLRLSTLIRLELAAFSNQLLVGAIETRSDPKDVDLVKPLEGAISRSIARIQSLVAGELAHVSLSSKVEQIEHKYRASLADGSWTKVFPGREILRTFVGLNVSGVQYEYFRNLILSQMRDHGHKPPGMTDVIEKILDS